MICRLWRGWTTKDNADAYERIVREEVIPGIEARRIPGFRGIDLVRRERDRDVEFMTLMWFDTLGSVRGFMGDDYEAAHVLRVRRRCSPTLTGAQRTTRYSTAANSRCNPSAI
jgi:heme-degrading monooxygenase HmoA